MPRHVPAHHSPKNADGSTVEYHHVAENAWDAKKGCAVAKVVYNFGRADQMDGVAMRRFGGDSLAFESIWVLTKLMK